MDRIVSSSHDRTSLLSTHKVLRNTYFLLSLTLAFFCDYRNCQYGADAAISGSDSDAGGYVWFDVPDL